MFRAVEVQLDLLLFFMSTIPESLLSEIGSICLILLTCSHMKRQEIAAKSLEILTFVKQILTSELVLPHFVSALDHDHSCDFKKIESAFDYLYSLVKES